MEIKDIILDQAFTATFEFQDSASGNTCTYSIIKASDGSSFATGSATWVGSGIWRIAFTPTTDAETYILIVNNTTLGVTRTAAYRATARPQVVTAEITGTTASDMLAAVNQAIMGILNGGGVKQYTMNGRMVTYEDLPSLRAFRSQLTAELQCERSGDDQTTYAQMGEL